MRRPFAFQLLFLGIAACAGDGSSGGRLQVTRDGSRLFASGATATYCDSDTTLTIVGIGARWTGALALRTTWPTSVPRSFPVGTRRDTLGTSLLALRDRGDSLIAAYEADSGDVRLEPGPGLVLRFGARLIRPAQDTMRTSGEVTGTVEARCT